MRKVMSSHCALCTANVIQIEQRTRWKIIWRSNGGDQVELCVYLGYFKLALHLLVSVRIMSVLAFRNQISMRDCEDRE